MMHGHTNLKFEETIYIIIHAYFTKFSKDSNFRFAGIQL